jgi:tetratricopeptide (TPR) repeat protein
VAGADEQDVAALHLDPGGGGRGFEVGHRDRVYATRRNGDPAASLPLYEKALAIDPKHRGAHEYIGEAYLMLGNVAKAKEHLARLDSLCFMPCSEYRDLKKAVERYEKTGKVSATH